MAWPPTVPADWSVHYQLPFGEDRILRLYYVNDTVLFTSNAHINLINPTAKSVTRIMDQSADVTPPSPGQQGANRLAYVNNTLYLGRDALGLNTGGYDFQVWQYNGTPHNWTKVYEDLVTDAGNSFLINDATDLVLVNSPKGTGGSYHTVPPALGTWSTVSFSDSNPDPIYSMDDTWPVWLDNDDGVYRCFYDGSANYYVYKYASGTWTRQNATDMGGSYIRTPGYHWRRFASDHYQWSTNLTTWTSPTDQFVKPIQCQNYEKTIGYYNGAIYYWNDSTNQWTSADNALPWTFEIDSDAFVMSDGTLIVPARGGTQTPFLLKRDDLLDTAFIPSAPPPPAGNIEFYYGTNTLALKSDVPFDKLRKGGMAVRRDKRVALGANDAGSDGELVIIADKIIDYATWEDVTQSLTNVPVNSVKWINGDLNQ